MAGRKSKKLSELMLGDIKEVAPGVTIEKLSAQYFDATKLLYQPEPLYRLDSAGHRYYYNLDKDGEPTFYTSVTTLIKNTLPTPPSLIKWIADRGQDAGQAEALERASYGTFLHSQCGDLLVTGKYDLNKLANKLKPFLKTEGLPEDRIKWQDELKKDMLAFAQFMIDYDVKPLAIEICLFHPTDGYAGALDIVAELTWKKNRIRAIVDIKSGRKGFYESHEIQLQAYKRMWDYHFPQTPIDRVFNFSPKDWRKSPTYNFKDQTDSANASKLQHLVELAKIEDSKRENKITIISDMIDLTAGLSGNVQELTFAELVKKNAVTK